jgi:excisionase family DNA binding protein
MGELMTVREVARLCRVHEVTVRRHIASGRLKAVRVGRQVRVRSEDVDNFVNASAVERQLKPFTLTDPLWNLVGIVSRPDLADWSSDKYKYLGADSEGESSSQQGGRGGPSSWTPPPF